VISVKSLFSEKEIKERVKEIAQEIEQDFPQGMVVLGVLKGAFVFMADLIREFSVKVEIDFIRVCSYHSGLESSGEIKITKDLEIDVECRDVLVVEDILDSGLTLNFLHSWLIKKNPRSLKFCVLIDKKERCQTSFTADYIGFSIDDGFLVGYGLDYNEKYRNMRGIFALDEREKAAL